MDLWIRSQDKLNLLKVSDICIFDENEIVSYNSKFGTDYYIILGKYKSKERALKVLDEISSFISNDCQEFIEMTAIGETFNCMYINVYQMPKE